MLETNFKGREFLERLMINLKQLIITGVNNNPHVLTM